MGRLIFLLLCIWSMINAEPFITGNSFKEICQYSLDECGFDHNPKGLPGYWFVKTDFLNLFFEKYMPNEPFILISHNSDFCIDERYFFYLNLPQLIHWYAQNVEISHPKISSIPIGICNFANHEVLEQIRKKNLTKKTLVYANYMMRTNPTERKNCLRLTGVKLSKHKPFQVYLTELAESYFVLSPKGNGLDCHRTWEALYLKTIPIVTRDINIQQYEKFPIIILDSWEEFKSLQLSPELYHEMWKNFDFSKITIFDFIKVGQ